MAVISCERAWELLSQQLDGPLSPQEMQELEEHLASCPACRKEQEELKQLDRALRDLGDIPAPADFTQRVMDQVRAESQKRPKVISLWRRPQVRALAGLAACALLCIGIYRVVPQESNPSSGVVTASEVAPTQQPQTADRSAGGDESGQEQQPEQAQSDEQTVQPPAAQPRTADLAPAVPDRSEVQEKAQTEQPVPETADGSSSAQEEEPQGKAQVPQVTTASVQTELVVSSLSEQARALLPAQEDWSVDDKGNVSCAVSSQVLQALCQVLDQEGTEYTVTSQPWSETCIVRLG